MNLETLTNPTGYTFTKGQKVQYKALGADRVGTIKAFIINKGIGLAWLVDNAGAIAGRWVPVERLKGLPQ